MKMQKTLAALLALLLMGAFALAEPAEDDFNVFFSDGGYTGQWVTIDALHMEFCLPDDWVEMPADDGSVYTAISPDGTVTMDIRVEATGVDSIADWAEDHLTEYALDDAGLYEAVVVEPDANRIGVAIRLYDGALVHFRFARADEEDMPREYALEIAGSTSENWLDGGDMDDTQDDSFDEDFDDDFFPEIDDVFGDD